MPSLTNILLHSIAYMAEKFPDKWMEKIPYYRAREEELEEEERETRRRARKEKEKRRHSHSHKLSGSHRRARHLDNDEESDSYDDEEYDRRDRRRHRSLDGRRQQPENRSTYRKSYNPADYAPVDRYGYAVQPPVNGHTVVNGPVPGATPATTSFTNGSRPTSTSGPIPGYVPYAHVYNKPSKSQHAGYSRDARDSPRSSSDRFDRKDYRTEPRGGRYEFILRGGSEIEADTIFRYNDSHDYDSSDDAKYRRRSSRYD
ncbi:unnamed protein product [Aureobasidium uvarum]|uniref:Uncharacterized protein n=1 Tax=Aureobasidium uvarum TaxID=2773716 RepID=A0A9N8KK13_9PEZI|nr:unnamed protein product [Aureobasidium uvarum]